MTCQASSARQDGRASTASGSSQSEYCGDHTLLVSRKAATTRKSSCGSRGRRGASRASASTPATASTTAIAAMPLTSGGEPPSPVSRWSTPYQSESKSAGRSRLSSKKRRHDSGYTAAIGRLTADQAIAAPSAARQKGVSCRDRQHSASSGTKKSTG